MSSTIVVPKGFSYVTAALLSTVFVLFGQTAIVGKLRKASGIKYPQPYAEKAEVEASKEALKFNCAQRAHANTLEAFPIILTTTLVTSLKYPILAAVACGLWSVSRVAYTRGYVTGIPANRNSAISRLGSALSFLGLVSGSIWTAVGLIRAGI